MFAANQASHFPSNTLRKLPPLILHPFSDSNGPGKLMESSRASMMIQGLLPTGDKDKSELDRTLLRGRYQEIRMLFYVGRDINRWIEQCLDFIDREPEWRSVGLKAQSFAEHLIKNPPPSVEAKLRKWGVGDFRAIFTRALGLNAVLADAPSREMLNDEFIRTYFRYADQMYTCWVNQSTFSSVSDFPLEFDIFASGEYSRLLEREWSE